MHLRTLALALVALSVACGGAGQASPTPVATLDPTAPPTATATASPTAAPAAAGSVTFTLATGSKAIVRVNEQLADRNLPSDAVLTTEKVTGSFTLQPNGTFTADSRIVADLTALSSDSRQRDDFIKQSTLETRRFPEAVFFPKSVQGLALPLAASGDLKFQLVGQMTIHGVTKGLTFDVLATRTAAGLTATATVVPSLTFSAFGMEQPRVFSVLTIKDDIRLEVQLAAKEGPPASAPAAP
ncbi:MAG: YceI family protein [Chloroflexi bacterium]|nr:YceI family protein [Chloroflexota bacterium]